ncbi:MAG: GNAT family N-acetyltransferase, partial [Chloroflexota bacterium]|nr:GNAT family N-acetyltransferase [Chloroflexota bacterium]
GTHPEYRRRGLVRRQMEVVHRWSAERGELMQAITGIPWYYRQFGYEMTLQRYAPRQGYRHTVPALASGREEPYRLRPATEADLPFIASFSAAGRQRSLLSCVRDAAQWRYELSGRSAASMTRHELHVIEPAGATSVAPVGFLAYSLINGPFVRVAAYELAPGTSWLHVTRSVLRHLIAAGEAWERATPGRRLTGLSFALGANHPAYAAAPSSFPFAPRPSAHYVRVPDLPRFLRHIAPVLEARLARSPAAGCTGELRLSFYRDGVRLSFDAGRLRTAEPWAQPERHEAGACLPGLTILQLVFGHRSLAELQHAFADCLVREEPARVLLEALFPPRPSEVWLLD